MNVYTILAVALFAAVFLGVYGAIYLDAISSYKRGDLDWRGIRILRLGLYGHLTIFAILAVTAFLI
ncbi:hypothetical protein B9Q03_12545 [Candidatus Marsarchaeota G2 archaeon OSP_D]|jgi:hypothetical protein|uniref:Uncharacterized protein n=5 Tax=Candidatus Marsarchaeota TaxID=1978152 RepID=A0A2R6B360_9ARCH|nr:MAG: hypothetical protein B9Q03_12545 [Candidatus Marsarchaeota G2 archaeon OSP_D]PSN86611.1 MAG: hypothetical protein B9Q00_10265 [Candidatus Marsarchaeota G1 archaeon OSP_C]PSN93023.1 MAG: hypothetical protein B9Q06_12865 [Candidatus Marsarchaeota G2 archaeon ECH_B_2]PSN97159.1 MAG: hypothetical protein B9Q07_12435 [Candidatus Marsarchaeota G2 archaeon ECH_B_3]PSN98369.1 MAG: hypothetical protein B9Q05_12785 [Candidatus Marsarchaeota G2 archaeon ECH_B_1]